MNPKCCSVWHRCLFEDMFFMDFDERVQWTCFHDTSVNFGAGSKYPVKRLKHISIAPLLTVYGLIWGNQMVHHFNLHISTQHKIYLQQRIAYCLIT